MKRILAFLLILVPLSSFGQEAKPIVSITLFGLTLGKPWPTDIPSCFRTTQESNETRPCHRSGAFGVDLYHVPFQSGSVSTSTIDGRIEMLLSNIPEMLCEQSISALKEKLGTPQGMPQLHMQNGFGATWIYTQYLWQTNNGDEAKLHVHLSKPINCFLMATSQRWRNDPKNQTQKPTF